MCQSVFAFSSISLFYIHSMYHDIDSNGGSAPFHGPYRCWVLSPVLVEACVVMFCVFGLSPTLLDEFSCGCDLTASYKQQMAPNARRLETFSAGLVCGWAVSSAQEKHFLLCFCTLLPLAARGRIPSQSFEPRSSKPNHH